MTKEDIITCSGCEAECQVHVVSEDNKIVLVEGNNCPTGEIFAKSIVNSQIQKQHKE